jgi:hypothetical protein
MADSFVRSGAGRWAARAARLSIGYSGPVIAFDDGRWWLADARSTFEA